MFHISTSLPITNASPSSSIKPHCPRLASSKSGPFTTVPLANTNSVVIRRSCPPPFPPRIHNLSGSPNHEDIINIASDWFRIHIPVNFQGLGKTGGYLLSFLYLGLPTSMGLPLTYLAGGYLKSYSDPIGPNRQK